MAYTGSAESYEDARYSKAPAFTTSYSSGPNSYGMARTVEITDLFEQDGASASMVASWDSPLAFVQPTRSFDFQWWYLDASGEWLLGATSSLDYADVLNAVYHNDNGTPNRGSFAHRFSVSEIASNASVSQLRVRVRPVAEETKRVAITYPDGDSTRVYEAEVAWYACDWSGWAYADNPGLAAEERALNAAPERPSAPTVAADGDDTVTVAWSGVESPATHARVELYAGDALVESARVAADAESWSAASVLVGVSVRARIAAYNDRSGTWSDYSPWSDRLDMRPYPPQRLAARAVAGAVRLDWIDGGAVGGSYRAEVSEYADAWDEGRDDIKSYTPPAAWTGGENHCTLTGLSAGARYHIRLYAVSDAGESDPSGIASVMLGAVPDPPVTRATAPTVIAGDAVRLVWTHSCADNSAQAAAEVWVSAAGSESTVSVGSDEFLDYTAPAYDGAEILWKVRTQGVSGDWSEWSAVRRFTVYTRPAVGISAPSSVSSLPAVFMLSLAPGAQSAVEWSVEIAAEDAYTATARDGREVRVAAGQAVWSAWMSAGDAGFDGSHAVFRCGAGAGLASGQSYTATARVLTDAGLIGSAQARFSCGFADASWVPALSVEIADAWSAVLVPSCHSDVRELSLSVYRVSDTVQEIASGLASGQAASDPHPDLGTCTYRVVATDPSTGVSAVRDFECIVPGTSILVDWDGNRLELPYNARVSESGQKDSGLKHYIGRTWPVGYHGTAVTGKGTLRFDLVKREDRAEIAALRALMSHMGSAYIRAPGGLGFWADVDVSLDRSYDSALVAGTITYTRVESEGA